MIASLSVLAACGRPGDPPSSGDNTSSFVSVLRGLGAGADYEPHGSPEELGSEAAVTLLGRIESVDDGRVFGTGPTRDTEPAFLSTTLTVRAERVLAGNAAVTLDDLVYVELSRTKAASVSDADRAMPPGQRVILFLDDYTEGPGDPFRLLDDGPIPAGATVFAPYAEGLLLEDTSTGRVVGGLEPLEALAPAWRQATSTISDFVAAHFPRE